MIRQTQSIATRARILVSDFFRRYPWLGWAAWIVFCLIALARTHPRRFASTYTYYLEAAERLLAHQQVYDPHTLGAFLYLPVSLLILAPLTKVSPVLGAALSTLLYAVVFSLGCYALASVLFEKTARKPSAPQIAGLVLLINIPAAWFNFKGVQSQSIMTGGMMMAAAAIAREQWLRASVWLIVATAFKPLALVMAFLCFLFCPRMRIPLVVGVAALLLLPFLFFDVHYVVELYTDFFLKLMSISTAPVEDWPYRADIATLLSAIGIEVSGAASIVVRALAVLPLVYVVWQARKAKDLKAFAFALVFFSACYVNLFSPRNEFLSFILVTPSLALIAFLFLQRDEADWRGWLLIALALILGMWWNLSVRRHREAFHHGLSVRLAWIDGSEARTLAGAVCGFRPAASLKSSGQH